jgi:hypothetical protein
MPTVILDKARTDARHSAYGARMTKPQTLAPEG